MKQYGLLGGKLSHSYSPAIHQALGLANYQLFEVPPCSFPESLPAVSPKDLPAALSKNSAKNVSYISENPLEIFLQNPDIQGLNVTIPYKKTVIKYCHALDVSAQKIGSVNTMLRQVDGTWTGYNTDYYGFMYLLKRADIDVKGKKVLVFGSGGASLTVCAALQDLRAQEIVVISRSVTDTKGTSRTASITDTKGIASASIIKATYADLHKYKTAHILVQTTPVGMYPNNQESLISLDNFPACEGVIDLIYNPLRTNLILEAKERNLKALGGLPMLIAQAVQANEIFQGKTFDTRILDRLTEQFEKQMANIVLIGMPGCGKTSIGKLLAKVLNRPFIDLDHEIERRYKASPSSIISSHGEAVFRDYEQAFALEFGKQSGLVIATGGGLVTRAENYAPLAQQGTIVWIRRPLELLSKRDRILSQQEGVASLYKKRKDLYARFADCVLDNEQLEETVLKLVKLYGT